MYNNEIHTWAFGSEYIITSLKSTEKSNRFLIDDPWRLWGPGGGSVGEEKVTLDKYYNKNVKYYIELNSDVGCNSNNDLIVGIYKDGIKVENTHYKIKLMNPNEVKERLRFRNQ